MYHSPTIDGTVGMFIRLQPVLRNAQGYRITLSASVHSRLTLWRHLVTFLAARSTHLIEIRPKPQTCIGATNASLIGMVGVCFNPLDECHLWRLAFSTTIKANMLTDKNPQGFLMINDLELAAYTTHLHLFTPCTDPL